MNPYTYHLHEHIYKFFSEPYHLRNISEFQSISFHEISGLYLEIALLIGVIIILVGLTYFPALALGPFA